MGYALAVTITVLIAPASGYRLLERALIGNVAQLLEAENVEVAQDLGRRWNRCRRPNCCGK